MTVTLLIDGREVAFQNEIKVIYEEDPTIGEQLHLTVTNEGLVTDVVICDDVEDTTSETFDEILNLLGEVLLRLLDRFLDLLENCRFFFLRRSKQCYEFHMFIKRKDKPRIERIKRIQSV